MVLYLRNWMLPWYIIPREKRLIAFGVPIYTTFSLFTSISKQTEKKNCFEIKYTHTQPYTRQYQTGQKFFKMKIFLVPITPEHHKILQYNTEILKRIIDEALMCASLFKDSYTFLFRCISSVGWEWICSNVWMDPKWFGFISFHFSVAFLLFILELNNLFAVQIYFHL